MAEPTLGSHQLEMGGDWALADLSGFGRQYSHLYVVLYSLQFHVPELRRGTDPQSDLGWIGDRTIHAYSAYPWRGGYSAVNFYQSLLYQVPKNHRPRIVRIEYASPGWLELALVEVIARSIRRIVNVVADTFLKINATYSQIYRDMHERKLMRISAKREELALSRDQQEFARTAAENLANKMEFQHLRELRAVTGNDVATLKIVLSIYRRARELAKLHRGGKMKF